ncbi:hypothetical protein DD702_05440 [Bifidobacterium animalis subsp. lactis]|nr:hypothetical protein CJD49_02825 [Bifidobacterium animalis subsp. lactis]KAB5633173.1 ATP-binding cassette domain-containing protein [Bifidobacterium animalis]KAB7477999.1 ATP-binding cassette domain-containing protein [Bifidobacterium bifidum]PIN32305.1 hypothetical protein CUC13_03200 [Bifidobacterium animalis subsp. lactis BB-12]AYD76732.1 ATP-binding cassette domain-containing protein [Bifidobacterium animalis subsp. lactis]
MGTQTASNSEGRNPIVARAVDLCKRYGKGDNSVIALDHVNVEFRRKALTAIMGPSGSGKSTLMHCMAGLDTPPAARCSLKTSRSPQWANASSRSCVARRSDYLPVVQSGSHAHREGEHTAATADCPPSHRYGLVRQSGVGGQVAEPSRPSPEPAVRRPTAARRLCAGDHGAAERDLRRRTDRQPRFAVEP